MNMINESGFTDLEVHNDSQSFRSEDEDMAYCSIQYIIYTPLSKLIFSLLYLIIFCFGFFGNLLVALAVIKSKHMRTVTNYFILNLALSDIVMCLFSVPFTPLQSFSGKWMFGEVLCKLFPFSQGVSVYISTLTLTIIALDRFVVIIYPFRARMQVKTCLVLIWIIDMLACLFTGPYAYHVTIENDDTTGDEQCNETWGGLRRTIYGAFTNITQFVLPFITIILCYTAIIRKLTTRSHMRPGMRSAQREEVERARNLKTNRMLISMVIVFGICWLPLNCINLLADLEFFPIFCWEYYHLVFFVCHVMAMSSTCYNPFLYGWHNDSFQKEFIRMMPVLKGVCGAKTNGNDQIRCQILRDNETTNAEILNASLLTRMTSTVRRVSIKRSISHESRRTKMKHMLVKTQVSCHLKEGGAPLPVHAVPQPKKKQSPLCPIKERSSHHETNGHDQESNSEMGVSVQDPSNGQGLSCPHQNEECDERQRSSSVTLRTTKATAREERSC
ncbi:hypothetical protein TCAL_09216 [Tigriopus californicus]|uniref:G-protein coupled receptors family 1 profile domain-containing protein n=1 Tax=Tigriopus californicus TaxID=6832 RepID=A0A553PH17_TIGCA|nr:prolactin-releasing peptide receptor-like [Tigriopus californicus]XP_059082673.1 prolactin-releasing peptide receptor-like [Tigriopus californicus]XP_059082674.1 prolactin-releasing peptide receptor-like [Tigriopus californicus]XP_059082675.1 prolactin-releasing peptide receptor-like [Tigriopus californicus]TRY76954.1 hypothetical protein TCAL_09216 [Tigriopus californicus]|eukprot:TCALIF_09216-PA protein Name:"Similar to NPFR Neuropeptide F receptor (Drosophila melanogaster)" AED:0.09 eAED:0.09 QI:0/-1/0/1/-1/1/1/0/500